MAKRSASAATRRPITDWRKLSLTFGIDIIAGLFHQTPKTIRKRVREKTFPVMPFQRHPMLWYKVHVQKYFEDAAAAAAALSSACLSLLIDR